MLKYEHEIRDPIHVFIRLDSAERKVLDSQPFQRLRRIHQLALTYLVYPGATHRRFEHSVGVMELASRVYDIVTNPDNIHDSVREIIPKKNSFDDLLWRRVLRMAALCHDIGHLPFSHAAEKELLPDHWDHERLGIEIIRSDELTNIWNKLGIDADKVAKLSVGPENYRDAVFTDWEVILSEIIVGSSFGVDRIDYVLRDSYHAGVAYGKFDHYRLLDSIRILPLDIDGSTEPTLGIEFGGLESAEALLWARYLMHSQVYYHPVRRIYDIHLKDFLKEWLDGGVFPTETRKHLRSSDDEIIVAMHEIANNPSHGGHDPASRIIGRGHYKVLYERNPEDMAKNLEAGEAIYRAACEEFSPAMVRHDSHTDKSVGESFPVITRDGRVMSSLSMSETLNRLPVIAMDYVFIAPELKEKAQSWLRQHRQHILTEVRR